jgi:D-alanyl-D-alanine endopeptidase (penicillin-binding protein 7)
MRKSLIQLLAAFAALMCGALTTPSYASDESKLHLQSASVLVLDEQTGEVLYGRNSGAVQPIASITKLMTALVTLEAKQPLDDEIAITDDDIDTIKGTHSRLRIGSIFTRDDLLKLALMASENRAASALGRSYPGGREACVRAMNAKARELGMKGTHYVETTGLSSSNVSTAEDLAKLVRVAQNYPLIREYSTLAKHEVMIGGHQTAFSSTNGLVRAGKWDIVLQKTGYITEAGRCMVMQAKLAARSVIIVLLDSVGKYTRIADANRIREWLEPDYHSPKAATRIVRAKAKSQRVRVRSSGKIKVVRSSGRIHTQLNASAR